MHEDEDKDEEEVQVVQVINLCPRRPCDAAAAAAKGFTADRSAGDNNNDFRSFWHNTVRDRPLRMDGRGGLDEFFIPGSPTFVRSAQPVLVGLATIGGLAVLGAVLSV